MGSCRCLLPASAAAITPSARDSSGSSLGTGGSSVIQLGWQKRVKLGCPVCPDGWPITCGRVGLRQAAEGFVAMVLAG